jgi:hypothetical protein
LVPPTSIPRNKAPLEGGVVALIADSLFINAVVGLAREFHQFTLKLIKIAVIE